MKIIHLSDIHINPEILFKIDTQDRFKLALNHIKNNHADANILIITGDLTHYGNNESYKIFIKILKEVNLPEHLYPKLIQIGASSKFGKLTSKHLNIKSRECKFNPDWDSDIILKLFDFFGNYLDWTPPSLPKISACVEGKRFKTSLDHIKKIGLNEFIKKNKIFSYAITSPNHINYTIFKSYHSNAKKS